ncbi:MAG: DUF3109 family protein [Bacteroidota bacterium]
MIIADDILVSDFIEEEKFHCNIKKCKGACCVKGDSGAPLEEEEVGIIEYLLENISSYMQPEGISVVEQNGVLDYDEDGSIVTPMINGEECAFVYFDHGIALCAIEKAWREGKSHFQKPVSCHLYPIRISTFNKRDAVNYHNRDICDPARYYGHYKYVPRYKFTKDALLRKYGKERYQKLEKVIE